MSDRQRQLALVAGSLLLLCVAGYLLGPVLTRDPAQKVRFMIWGSPEEVRVVQSFLNDFRVAHPEIAVEVEHAPAFGYAEKLRIQFLGGNPPDVMYLSQEFVEDFARQNYLKDLTPLEERDRAELEPEDFYPEVYQRFRHEGKLYGVSKDFATLVLYYNKDLFQKWDVPYPKPGWTWDDFLETAKKLTRGGDYGFLLETWNEELFPWIWQAGGEVASEDPPAWLMGDPRYIDQNAEALQFLRDLIWVHKVSPGPSVTRDQGGNALFVRGKVAMCTYGRWACMEFKGLDRFDWDVIELPRKRKAATSTFAVSYAMSAQSKRPEQAWTLIKFLTSKAQQEKVAHSVQAIPARRSVAEGPAFLKPKGFEHLGYPIAAAPHTDSVPYGRFSPRFRGANEAKQKFNQAVDALWNGSEPDAKALLKRIQPEVEAVLARQRK
ncbi:MAG: sugar ABC transporter substrate-binding protein [Planctomycetes bacterium]|nr:sugar ABC transporter substrate-binding protein [Planctomycetota bacterium]